MHCYKGMLAVFLISVFSTKAETLGDWVYSVENGEATITSYTGNGGAVEIPSEVNGTPVKKIGGGTWVFGWGNTTITSITIPNSVTSLGNSAFDGMRNLFYLFLPSTVTNIGNFPFSPTTTVMTDPLLQKIANNETFVSSVTTNNSFVTALANNSEFITAVATNNAFITAVASKILAASNNYGLATQIGVSNTITATTSNLATKAEITTAINEGRAAGIASVAASPNNWNLFTASQIQGMAIGDLVLTRTNGGEFVLNYDIEQSEDLVNWTPYQGFAMPLTNLPTNKAFVRIKAKQ